MIFATQGDVEIMTAADEYARVHRLRIAKEVVSLSIYPREEWPWTVFMAGSPGAGKTEVSKAFSALLEELPASGFDGLGKVLRIDPDDFRSLLPGYTGNNSRLFNKAVSRIVESVLDRAFKMGVSFMLDGTLSSEQVADKNVRRALARGRNVTLMYVYQDPVRAWDFVLSREIVEGRNIPLEAFVSQYFSSRRTVKALKIRYSKDIRVDLLVQAKDGAGAPTIFEDVAAAEIDLAIPEPYSEIQMFELLCRSGGTHD